ncbi:hypothetical protein J3R82DRAFT_3641 [Butyriboletus roseoflavus]|nr:hypothetical protein J3R82DRAFT_3641 [Butyriboletus roseoflavus]
MSLGVLLSTTRTASEVLDAVLTRLRPHHWYTFDATVACAAIWTLLRWLRTYRQQLRTTRLRGPPSESFLYGVGKRILDAEDSGAIYEAWAQEYGPVYEIPATLGTKKIVLCDPKAIAYYYSKETWTYILTPFSRALFAMFVRSWCQPSCCTMWLMLGARLGKVSYGPMEMIIRGIPII